mgnify:CR=1 FL=1
MFRSKQVNKSENKKIGFIGEEIAEKHLKNNGYKIVEKNFLTKIGEIDIIAKQKDEYVFVEVKTSKYYKNSSFSPEFRVNKKKLKNIANASEMYRLEKKFQSKQKWRVDVISIILDENFLMRSIEHFENVFMD